MSLLYFKILLNQMLMYNIVLNNTVKSLNTGHFWLLKCCPIFGGVRYTESSVCRK